MLATETKVEDYPVHTGNIDKLVSFTKEKSHRMPSGLTREERKQWAMKIKGKV